MTHGCDQMESIFVDAGAYLPRKPRHCATFDVEKRTLAKQIPNILGEEGSSETTR